MPEFVSVWGFALHTPAGRISDWFRRADQAPRSQRYLQYPAREVEVIRAYIGDFPVSVAPKIFASAESGVTGYDRAMRSGHQARLRSHYLRKYLDEMLADVPGPAPAD